MQTDRREEQGGETETTTTYGKTDSRMRLKLTYGLADRQTGKAG